MRSFAVAGVTLLATVLLLATAALSRAGWHRLHEHGDTPWAGSTVRPEDVLGVMMVVVAVGVAVVSLVATVSRLSVRLREHRLTNLRLMGMPPRHTLIVAMTEVGTFATLGWVAGELLFVPVRPLLRHVRLAGEPYAVEQLAPQGVDHLLVVLLVPGLAVALGAWRPRRSGQELVQAGRRGDSRRPGWWRTVPLLLGAGLCWWVARVAEAAREADRAVPDGSRQQVLVAAALILTSIGMLLVVPVFVRLVADLLTRVPGRPWLMVAGRRLQAQPQGMTRVVAGLLIALFLASSALGVVAAYRSTPQFDRMHRMVTVEQSTQLSAEAGRVDQVVAAAEAVDGVRSAAPIHVAQTDCFDDDSVGPPVCWTPAFIGTCADLRAVVPEVTGCRGDVVQEIGYPRSLPPSVAAPTELTLWADGYEDVLPGGEGAESSPRGPSAAVPLPSAPRIGTPEWGASFIGPAVFVPSSLSGVADLLPATPAEIRVIGEPGRDLFGRLAAAGLDPGSWEDFSEYDRVIRTGQLVTSLSLILVSLGLLSFGISAIDRAVQRRREVISLQLVGAPARLLRASQWIEAALPLLLGCGLALWLGVGFAKAFLALAIPDRPVTVEVTHLWPALVAALVGSLIVALATSLAANPRIRPELIRAE